MLPKGLLKEYWRPLSMAIRSLDMAVMLAAGLLAAIYKFKTTALPSQYYTALAAGVLLLPVMFSFFSIYSSMRTKGFLNHVFDLCQAVCFLGLVLAGLAFITKSGEAYSREWFLIWMFTTLVLLVFYRGSLLLFLRYMRQHGMNERRIVIVGAGELGAKLASTVQQALWTGFRIVSFLDDHPEHAVCHPERSRGISISGIPVIQTPEDLNTWLTEQGIDEIWLALPLRAESRVKAILYELRHSTINTRFVLDIFGLDLFNHSITDIAGFPVLNISSTPMLGVNRLIKAVEDRLLALLILTAISPLLLVIAAAVKLTSPGPVFFKQKRLGRSGHVINVYKFRTMYQHKEDGNQVTQATAGDKRITPLGKFLRRSSLDELPQFINVLQGRMSIVGPRPHALVHNEQYKDAVHAYMQRHRVKPGITGWAQVNGWRGETDTLVKMQKRIEYDLFYINNWSLGFDLKIIFLTLFRGFVNRNAY